MNNEPVAWMYNYENFPDSFVVCRARKSDQDIPLYAHPVKEQSTNERIEMLKEMVEKIANPAGWIGYYEGKPATFLFKQEDVPRFLKNTDPVGSVIPLYTHPVKEQDESFDRTASHMAGEYVAYQKELTDEKINEVFKDCTKDGILDANEFARAILLKAQEK